MKRFAFPLDRVLAWRKMQARMERLRWEQLRAEVRELEVERDNLLAEHQHSAEALRSQGAATGADFAALDTFRKHVDSERIRLDNMRAERERHLIAQAQVTTAKERDVKVLEHLRERRLQAWTAELGRETEQQASEAFLARWRQTPSSQVK